MINTLFDILAQSGRYIAEHPATFGEALGTHILLSVAALLLATLLALPLGSLCYRNSRGLLLINSLSTIRVIPSLAVIALVLPILGTGAGPALLALVILALPPILINTSLGFRQVPAELLEAARGMGMDAPTMLLRIEFPLALPAIISGLRLAAVEVIAGATLAAFIGGGGLGTLIITGLSLYRFPILLAGAIPVALLALAAEGGFSWLESALRKQSGRWQPC